MATKNLGPWRGNVFGAEPTIQKLKVAAGSSTLINQGEICLIDASDDDVAPVTTVTDNLHAMVVANEEQVAGDPARFMEFIIPKLGDIFEFALESATAVKWGDELQIGATTPSQALTVSTSDSIAIAVNVNGPPSGTTWPTISSVQCMFKLANKAGAGKELPFIGADFGDAS